MRGTDQLRRKGEGTGARAPCGPTGSGKEEKQAAGPNLSARHLSIHAGGVPDLACGDMCGDPAGLHVLDDLRWEAGAARDRGPADTRVLERPAGPRASDAPDLERLTSDLDASGASRRN
jgi:hypothetical protein